MTCNAPLPTPERAVAATHIETTQPPLSHSPTLPTLPGEPVDTPHGPAWVRTARYPLAERPDLAEWLNIQPAALAAAGRDGALLRSIRRRPPSSTRRRPA